MCLSVVAVVAMLVMGGGSAMGQQKSRTVGGAEAVQHISFSPFFFSLSPPLTLTAMAMVQSLAARLLVLASLLLLSSLPITLPLLFLSSTVLLGKGSVH
jgi:hypothetical protein